mmetsp:Transcript_61066/g.171122  ORF Transcript_61066/g.171122 Transcript_61066/m.171122 type:complete len:367 (-) Transcript_61066:114-1214(-)
MGQAPLASTWVLGSRELPAHSAAATLRTEPVGAPSRAPKQPQHAVGWQDPWHAFSVAAQTAARRGRGTDGSRVEPTAWCICTDGGRPAPPPLSVPVGLEEALCCWASIGLPSSVVVKDDSAVDAGCPGNAKQELLTSFVSALRSGVGLSFALDNVGVLIAEARLKWGRVCPCALVLRVSGVECSIPLRNLDVTFERPIREDGPCGAWLVRLGSSLGQDGCTFVFDGTLDGQREAQYLCMCLRVLAERATMEEARTDMQQLGNSNVFARPCLAPDVLTSAPLLGCEDTGLRRVHLRHPTWDSGSSSDLGEVWSPLAASGPAPGSWEDTDSGGGDGEWARSDVARCGGGCCSSAPWEEGNSIKSAAAM